jgi:hypothetical protein
MYSTIVLLKSSGVSQGFTDLQAAENAAVAGDCIVIYPGTYALGAGHLILKNGVNKKFMPGVTISSSHANGTIIDNNVACVQTWEGEPTITNTNGLNKRIVLQNGDSNLNGFYFEFIGALNQGSTNAPDVAYPNKNTVGTNTFFIYNGVGRYQLNPVIVGCRGGFIQSCSSRQAGAENIPVGQIYTSDAILFTTNNSLEPADDILYLDDQSNMFHIKFSA